jgi:hypothetical protein
MPAARDFSAYYEGGYRFMFNPGTVYYEGNLPEDYSISPNPQYFRYSPFFLPLFSVPFVLIFNYHDAFLAFDLFQFALLPLLAYLIYKILTETSGKRNLASGANFACICATLLFALLQPLVPSESDLTFCSWSYFRLWLEGEARVLQLFLIVLTIYLLLRNSSFSGLPFILSSFDPRMTFLALPVVVFLSMRRKRLAMLTLSCLFFFCLIYIPTLLYANLGTQFFGTILINGFTFYSYEWITLTTISCLSVSVVYLELIQANVTERSLCAS